jgi:hypothetical protein
MNIETIIGSGLATRSLAPREADVKENSKRCTGACKSISGQPRDLPFQTEKSSAPVWRKSATLVLSAGAPTKKPRGEGVNRAAR